MLRRLSMLLLCFLVMNTTSCVLLQLVMVPFKLLFSLLGSAGSAVGVSDASEIHGPAPMVREAGTEKWLVEGLRTEAPCKIVCSAPGFVSRVYEWPGDFRGIDFAETPATVAVVLQASK